MSVNEASFERAVLVVAQKFTLINYAIRGTTSLVLQGFDMNVSDIDVLTDKLGALASNELLSKYLVSEVKYSENPHFRSYFGRFEVEGVPVELMGDWKVKVKDGWGKFEVNSKTRTRIDLKGQDIWVTLPKFELEAFLAMGRYSAFWKLKKQIEASL